MSIINLVCIVGLIFALVCDSGSSEGETTIAQPATDDLLDQIREVARCGAGSQTGRTL